MTERSGWLTLALMSALFFIITAATFDSLGVVLPAMVGELDWSWAEAGFGFTLLGFFCGITSTIPATLIREWGVRACLLVGTMVMAAGLSVPGAGGWLAALFRRRLAGGTGFHPAGNGARHLSPGAAVCAAIFRHRALFHRRRAGRCGRAAALSAR